MGQKIDQSRPALHKWTKSVATFEPKLSKEANCTKGVASKVNYFILHDSTLRLGFTSSSHPGKIPFLVAAFPFDWSICHHVGHCQLRTVPSKMSIIVGFFVKYL